ncbi:sporulation protein YqfC [Amphibacillus jilinensis]|uniref:sporulation protein YqfC n=1 Tax=Amphibacillus jilinensis TaxID=1216008 RepID=UPI0002FE6929|nr:sporulation protein YqfC [Amphibacillus jilinensis]
MAYLRSKINQIMKFAKNLPVDMQLKLPRITMIGDIHVYIENHHGILRFTSNEIVLKVTNGLLIVKGHNLVIKMLVTEEILIEGTINAVNVDEELRNNGVGQ